MDFVKRLEKVLVVRQVDLKAKVFHTFCYSAARRTSTLPSQLLLIIHKVIYFHEIPNSFYRFEIG